MWGSGAGAGGCGGVLALDVHALYSRPEGLVAWCDAWQREASGTLALLREHPGLHLEVTNVIGAAFALVLAGAQGGGGGGGGVA